jgi:hypothetical protein
VETSAGPAPINVLIGNPNARGLPSPETKIDNQDLSGYLEVALNERLSGFVEVPVRFLNPDINANTAGLADMNAGFKWAFLSSKDRVATFQLRTYIPTGAASHGLGTNHVSLEPAFLLYQRLSERLLFEGELRDWTPVGGTDFAGNVIRYGASFTYRAFERQCWSLSPVFEVVGWTVLGGKETAQVGVNVFEIVPAGGDTIINAKMGLRLNMGDWGSLYAGYGRALTGDVWYKNIVRVDYRITF